MSAYLCDVEHVSGLARWAVENDAVSAAWLADEARKRGERLAMHDDDYDAAPAVAVILARANVLSVAYRYPNDKPGDRPGPIGFKDDTDYLLACSQRARYLRAAEGVSPLEVLKAASCYDYQACETPEYSDSFARRIVERINSAAIAALPGYDEASWGWPEAKVAK